MMNADIALTLSFCVDPSGSVYNIRVMEERPANMGLAAAGKTCG